MDHHFRCGAEDAEGLKINTLRKKTNGIYIQGTKMLEMIKETKRFGYQGGASEGYGIKKLPN
jgi:hypothetical protein